jgi:SanA protein
MQWISRIVWKIIGYSFIALSLFVIGTNIWVIQITKERIVTNYELLPDSSVVLVLGTSNKLSNGSPNPYFEERITLAAELYKRKKGIHFLLSGDNRTRYYNEPEAMRKALLKSGVPNTAITLDYAGLRTLDSIIRCKEIFGQNKIIIVSQPFHYYRALFISDFYKMDAMAIWPAPFLPASSLKVTVREWFARAKAVIDLYILKTAPRHLGEPEPLDI